MKSEVVVWSKMAVLLATTLVSGVMGTCKFPWYMHSEHDPWVTGYERGDRFVTYIKDGIMKASSCRNTECENYERKCLDELPEGKYLTTHSEMRGTQKFVCIEFVKRSDIIMQLKQSNVSETQDKKLCDNLELNPWPLVSMKKLRDHKVTCPFSGGYNLHMFDPKGTPLCPREIMPIRLESECESGEGITLHFRKQPCIHPELSMKIKQKLYCLAHWTEGGYRFIIVRPANKGVRVWCLRITEPFSDTKDAYLFTRFICDSGDPITLTDKYLRLHLDKFVVSTTCADEFKDCSQFRQFCESGYRLHCSNSCGDCRPDVIPLCTFSEPLRSSWLQSMQGKRLLINISHYSINVESMGRFHCLMTKGKSHPGRSILLQLFDNGCYPRYTCIDIEKKAPSVIRYRLGKGLEWPLEESGELKSYICNDDQFDTGKKPMTVLINMEKFYSVPCALPTALSKYTLLRDDQLCEYCLIHDPLETSDKITLYRLNCSMKPRHVSYACLAAFDLHHKAKAVVLKTMHKRNEYICWVFTSQNKILRLPASECSNMTAHGLVSGVLKTVENFAIVKDVSRTCESLYLSTTMSFHFANTTIPPTSSSESGTDTVKAARSSTAGEKSHKETCTFRLLFVLVSYTVAWSH